MASGLTMDENYFSKIIYKHKKYHKIVMKILLYIFIWHIELFRKFAYNKEKRKRDVVYGKCCKYPK